MKTISYLSLYLIIFILLLTGCDKEKQEYRTINNQPETPINLNMTVGQKDYCEYYTYEPALTFAPKENFYGTYENHHSINLDDDNIIDFVLKRIESIDTSNNEHKYIEEIKFTPLNYIEFTVNREDPIYHNDNESHYGYDYLDTLDFNSTICDTCTEWYDEGIAATTTTITSPDGSTASTTYGFWNEFNKDKYFGFMRTYPDTIIGWVRMELQSEGNLIVIKDCGIKRKGVAYQ